VIRLEGASLTAHDKAGEIRTLLQPTDISIRQGERHLVLGKNGSGKTSLLRLLAGLSAPAAGRVLLDDVEIHPETTLWPRIAVLFEEPDPQFLADTVEAEIAFGLESMALPPEETRARTAEALDAHGLRAFAARDPRTLSAGEKTRTLLAAALAARPSVLLLDQCFAHLDPASRRTADARIAALVRGGGLSVLRVSQELDPPTPGEKLHLLSGGELHDVRDLTPAALLAATSAPLPLALRASAALAVDGRWSCALTASVEEFLAALSRMDGGAVPRTDPAAPPASSTSIPAPLLALTDIAWAPRRGATPVVEHVSLAVGPGEVVALVGVSGSGKSTLLHVAAGLREPTQGSVERAAPAVKRVPPVMLALEYPERQLFARTVAEDVAAALWIEGVAPDERARRAERALREVDLDPDRFMERVPGTLSEGEKRRAAVAAFLIEPPQILLWDEPTAGLDPDGRRALVSALARFKARGRAVLLASHDLDFVSSVADRVLVLGRDRSGQGHMLGGGPPESVWADAVLLARAGLPVPEHVRLRRALGARGWLPRGPVRDGDDLVRALARATAPLTG
jgi:energy-coupling factor transport system ATP-binding protein